MPQPRITDLKIETVHISPIDESGQQVVAVNGSYEDTDGQVEMTVFVSGNAEPDPEYQMDRTCVECSVDDSIVDSYTLDPNERENNFPVVRDEIAVLAQRLPFTVPVMDPTPDSIGAIMTSLVTRGRVAWN